MGDGEVNQEQHGNELDAAEQEQERDARDTCDEPQGDECRVCVAFE